MTRIERYKTKNKTYYYEKKHVVEVSLHEAFPEEADAETFGDGRKDQEPYTTTESTLDSEQLIMELSPLQVTLLLFKYLGYSQPEIRREMRLASIADVNMIELSLMKDASEFLDGAF